MRDNEGGDAPSTSDKIKQTRSGSNSAEQMKSGAKDNEDQRSKSVSKRKRKKQMEFILEKGVRRGEDKGK